MVELQIINRVLDEKSLRLINAYGLTKDNFVEYTDEFEFLMKHFDKYNKVPDKETFIGKFNDFNFIAVEEDDKYLISTIREELLYRKTVAFIRKCGDLLYKEDADAAVSYVASMITELTPSYEVTGIDIIANAELRLNQLIEKMNTESKQAIPSGFVELDSITGGWQRGEEFVVIQARTGQGKSWFLVKTLLHAWKIGNRVGFISPEMSANKLGYRADTLLEGFSNRALSFAKEDGLDLVAYNNHINTLKEKTGFIVAAPTDFNDEITVSKIKKFITDNKLDILGIDGISYLVDERAKFRDTESIGLRNVSRDLEQLSTKLGIPILVVSQSNRDGAKKGDGMLGSENISGSDGIGHNATRIISLQQSVAGLEIGIPKNREGAAGGKVTYFWDADKGIFTYLISSQDNVDPRLKEEKTQELKERFSCAGGAEQF